MDEAINIAIGDHRSGPGRKEPGGVRNQLSELEGPRPDLSESTSLAHSVSVTQLPQY